MNSEKGIVFLVAINASVMLVLCISGYIASARERSHKKRFDHLNLTM